MLSRMLNGRRTSHPRPAAETPSLAEERPPWIVRLVRALRPREGWAVLLLAWTAAISLPAAASASRLVVGLEPLAWLATLALILAWWLAGRRISGWAAAGLLALSGLAANLIWGVRVVRLWPLVPQVARWLAGLVGNGATAPAVTYFHEQGAALASFGQRLAWWVGGLISGRGMPDNLVVIGLAGLAAWALAAWAGWWVARRGQPFLAVLPTAGVLAVVAYWAENVRWALIICLASTTMLLVLGRLAWSMAGWEREGVDYSPEMRLDVTLIGFALTVLVTILAPTVPFLTSRQASQAFWRLFESPYRQVEERLSSSFAAVQPARSLVPPSGIAGGGMPRSHLLGGRPELGQEIALRVRVRGAPPDAGLYWRGQTFAVYTGRGWDESAAQASELRLAAGQPWRADDPAAAGLPLVNSVEVVAGSRAVLYAAGEPIAADRPYRARLRGPGELIALAAADAPERYVILSQVSTAGAAQLRQAGQRYPATVLSLYLQLPDDLDGRLAGLAADWTAGAATPYDRALTIESALRRLPYTLDVPAPPAGREVVSWFLFDLGRGYCDYFASAMVVLARLSGIPARLAVGYAGGAYDAETDLYTVTELNAHSWPELYFSGYGWLRFEPTPAQLLPALPDAGLAGPGPSEELYAGPGSVAAGMAEMRALAEVNAAAAQRRWLAQGLAGAANGLVLLGLLLGWWTHRGRRQLAVGVPPQASADFLRLQRWGARLGRPARRGETPREYVAAVIGAAAAIVDRGRRQSQAAGAAAVVIDADAPGLVRAYERALFGPEEPLPEPPQPREAPARLWAAFRRLWWSRARLTRRRAGRVTR